MLKNIMLCQYMTPNSYQKTPILTVDEYRLQQMC